MHILKGQNHQMPHLIKTLRLQQKFQYLADSISKSIFIENYPILIKISLKIGPWSLTDSSPALDSANDLGSSDCKQLPEQYWQKSLGHIELTHWGWVMHICISKLILIGSDNGLSPG